MKRVSKALFLTLALIDVILISIFVGVRLWLYGSDEEISKVLNISHDVSLAENFNYLKWILVIALLTYAAIMRRSYPFALLSVIYCIVLIDDALQIHENLGRKLVRMLELEDSMGLRAQDFGELGLFALLGSIILLLFYKSYALTRARTKERKFVIQLFVVFAALTFCGVGLDMLHSFLNGVNIIVGAIVGVVEDGGELLLTSATVAVAAEAFLSSREEAKRYSPPN